MTRSRQDKAAAEADSGGPGPDDAVLAGLRQVEAQYRETYNRLQQQCTTAVSELAQARDDNQALRREVALQRRELDEQRLRAQRQRETADALAAALKEIYRSLFSSNVYDLILKACLTLTGATRGLYLTTTGHNDGVHIRAAVDIDDYPAAPPSKLITALSRAALDGQGVSAYRDTSALPEEPADGEAFRNCLVAPVVLRNQVSGVVIVADKAGGDFDHDDADVLLSIGSQAAVAIENNRLQREVHEAYLSIVTLLAEAMAARTQTADWMDDAACRLAGVVAERLGLSEYDRSVVYYAALLHDIGKIGVSDGVLNKPGPLLDAERELIHAHAQIGHDLLRQIPILQAVAEIVRHHHERYDGSGYPDGLRGEKIPLAARIVAVVDAYFSMLAPRSYRLALTPEQAREELRQGAGTQFDPRVVDTFLAALDEAKTQGEAIGASIEVGLPGLPVERVPRRAVVSA